ncbi:hypothetical protein FHX82_003320 [Amycolatopsis bartoniae]|uniref:hypothetical protein n=1 Tax=Amycolatopsis bartoniae TaxID=941986 RepID=UPI001197A729|nr:hypothetical protein [Amycolatopsis bartoniae]MBB2936266.1 hypothetical protein [Amycolatopsis bartoniae]TVT11574.1 hypothetical protein FNH07_01805 [Amycolatopsis bartoniae]
MTNLILFLAVLVLLGYLIERNHRRQRPPRMNGSTPHENRDVERIAADLRGGSPSAPAAAERRVPLPRAEWHPVAR